MALSNALIKLRPEWDTETLKLVMTGSAEDGPEWQRHIGNKEKRRKLANRFKDSKDPFKIVIVRDMWLTGFDAPCLNTMYADKPMQGHTAGAQRSLRGLDGGGIGGLALKVFPSSQKLFPARWPSLKTFCPN